MTGKAQERHYQKADPIAIDFPFIAYVPKPMEGNERAQPLGCSIL